MQTATSAEARACSYGVAAFGFCTGCWVCWGYEEASVIVCIQCSMRALLADQPAPTFDETIEAHVARCHPGKVSKRERQELERRLAEKLNTEGTP